MGGSNGSFSTFNNTLSEDQITSRLRLVTQCTEDITHNPPTWLDADVDENEIDSEPPTCSLCFELMWCHGGETNSSSSSSSNDNTSNSNSGTTSWDWLRQIRFVAVEDTSNSPPEQQQPISALSCGHTFHQGNPIETIFWEFLFQNELNLQHTKNVFFYFFFFLLGLGSLLIVRLC